ncbi:MAG: LamG domain-containing protein [Candidatus Poribacteria bacterium]|nr:LamG domain-containing protein [Candidatus Poribacteria bacterium]
MWNAAQGQGRIDGKTIVADGNWHHIAKVYDGSKVQMFIDGKLDGEKQSGGKLDTNKSPIWIGARPGNVAATGLFDEVGFFTKALTEEQVNDVMDTGLVDYAAVEAAGKATITWGLIKKSKITPHSW